jgi:uncharacterized membrane protein YGL010W
MIFPAVMSMPRRHPLDEEILTMLTLKQQMQSYGAYHRDPRNKLTHFFGVPLVTFSLFLFLGWFRFVHPEVLPITVATLFYVGVAIYYFRLDWQIALIQLPFTIALLLLADWVATRSMGLSFSIFLGAFVVGWIIQLVGHAIEGRRPALADNILQVFNAPLFLTVEALAMAGFRRDLVEPEPASKPVVEPESVAELEPVAEPPGRAAVP